MPKILVIEDDARLTESLSEWLSREGYLVEHAHEAGFGLSLLQSYQYDLVILDWELPDFSGLQVCQSLRESNRSTPVLFLTGRGSLPDKELGFASGADDYLVKPFHMRELLARVKALLRRPGVIVGEVLTAGNIEMDTSRYRVSKAGKTVHLARMEYALLEFLLRHRGQIFSAEALLERVWPSDSPRSAEGLRTCIKRLRDKIDTPGEASIIVNVHGLGYQIL